MGVGHGGLRGLLRRGPVLRRSARERWGRRGGEGEAHCECGHPQEAHEHYRRGTDCALCGCARYRRA